MSTESVYEEARELEAAGNHGKAAALYKKLVAVSEDPRYHIAYGICLQHLGHWNESIGQLERAISLKPDYAEGDARLFLAESLLRAGRNEEAIAQWRIVAAMEPEYPSYEAVPNEARKRLAQYTA